MLGPLRHNVEDRMSFDPHALKLYVDGSCLRNPGGNSGHAAWLEFPCDWNLPDRPLDVVGFHESTNNRMELRAVIWAYKWVQDQGSDLGVSRVQIVTDSQYVKENFYRAQSWKQNHWRNAQGRPVENADLWKELLSLRTKTAIRTDLEWMLGKKSPITKAVDKSAKGAAKQPTETDRGFRSGKIGRAKNKVGAAASLFPASGQQARIRIYQTSAFSDGENKIKFQLYSDDRQDYFSKFVAYASPEVGFGLHRQHAYSVQFNANPKYPVIQSVIEEL